MKPIVCLVLLVLIPSCVGQGERGDGGSGPQPVGGEADLASLLDSALRRADPQGAVLVVVWTTGAPPPSDLLDLAGRWVRYGLVPVGVCVDLLQPGVGRGEGIARIREWEGSHPVGLRSLIYDGEASALRRRLGGAESPGSITLLSEHGSVLWVGEEFGDLGDLEAILKVHLGEPSVAEVDGGCICLLERRARVGPS